MPDFWTSSGARLMRPLLLVSLLPLSAVSGPGCVTTGPRITKRVPQQLRLVPTATHRFRSVVIDREGGMLLVYGMIHHGHESPCPWKCHVQLKVTAADGRLLRKVGLPVVNRGTQNRGWFGASFRVKLPWRLPRDARLTLVMRDCGCKGGAYFVYPDDPERRRPSPRR